MTLNPNWWVDALEAAAPDATWRSDDRGDVRVGVVVLVNYRVARTRSCGRRACTRSTGPRTAGDRRRRDASGDSASGSGARSRRSRSSSPAEPRLRTACNLGAAAGSGQFVAFLNNDARADPTWLRGGRRRAARTTTTIGCVASKVLTWDGSEWTSSAGAWTTTVTPSQPHHDAPDDGRWDEEADVLFPSARRWSCRRPCSGSSAGSTSATMFFEDVDLGLADLARRPPGPLRPESIVYHRGTAASDGVGDPARSTVLDRNALPRSTSASGATELPPAASRSPSAGLSSCVTTRAGRAASCSGADLTAASHRLRGPPVTTSSRARRCPDEQASVGGSARRAGRLSDANRTMGRDLDARLFRPMIRTASGSSSSRAT